jgi:hypothetical protein
VKFCLRSPLPHDAGRSEAVIHTRRMLSEPLTWMRTVTLPANEAAQKLETTLQPPRQKLIQC